MEQLEGRTAVVTGAASGIGLAIVEAFIGERIVCADLPHELRVTVVYGHTPSPNLAVRWNRPFGIGIDTGAVYGGNLTALRLPDEKLFQI